MTESSAHMLAEIQAAAEKHGDWAQLDLSQAPNIHIAIMSEPFLSFVLAGKKTVESRFSLKKIAPYSKAQPGDIVFMKAGPIVACFTVAWVKTFDMDEYPIAQIAKEYGEQICGDTAFWKRKSAKRFATLMGIQDVRNLTPTKITKLDQRAWATLS